MCAQISRVIEKVLAQPNYESYFAGCMKVIFAAFNILIYTQLKYIRYLN